MVISQPPGNNPSYYYRGFTNAASIALNASRDTLCSIHALQHQGNHRNGAIKHDFYTNQIHGGIISRLFFIHFVAPYACSSSRFKILLQIFLYEDLSTLALHTSVGCISLQNASNALCYAQPILLSENIPNI